jgi:hypothetical protein
MAKIAPRNTSLACLRSATARLDLFPGTRGGEGTATLTLDAHVVYVVSRQGA